MVRRGGGETRGGAHLERKNEATEKKKMSKITAAKLIGGELS